MLVFRNEHVHHLGVLLEHHGLCQPLPPHLQLLRQHPHLLCKGQQVLGRMFKHNHADWKYLVCMNIQPE